MSQLAQLRAELRQNEENVSSAFLLGTHSYPNNVF